MAAALPPRSRDVATLTGGLLPIRIGAPPPPMKILVHDYAGHAFPPSLSRALAARGHQVVHAFASSLQTPRGELQRNSGDAPTLEFEEIPMVFQAPKRPRTPPRSAKNRILKG